LQYFGVPLMGGVLHTLNPRLSTAELAYVMNHAGDSVLLVDDVLLPVLERLRGQVKLKHVVVWTNGTQAPEGMIDYEELIALEPEEFARPRLDEREAACMCYTSGTTGRPKGVVYSHRAIVLHSLASAMTDGLAIGQREVLCPVVPMFHVNGNALMGHPAVADAAVIAAKHPKRDERPVAVVVVRDGASVTAEELRAFLEPKFAKFWLPDEFVFASQIPRTAAGKFQKSTLREQYRGLLIERPRPATY
jgi:fatty-acyl-CoA synthase